jgi:diacylglycerol kinase (ATP)
MPALMMVYLMRLLWGISPKFELLKLRPALYNGDHVKHSKIREIKTTTVSVESEERMFVEADGDIIGECPVTFQVMPSILNVVVF